MSTLAYVGIGSSRTPRPILDAMARVAEELAIEGFILRCGRGGPADDAFERGALAAGGLTEFHLPWPGFCGRTDGIVASDQRASDLCRGMLSHWRELSDEASLTERIAAHLVFGADLRTPSLFLITWTPDGAEWDGELSPQTGRSAASIALCSRLGIPVFNLKHEASQLQMRALLNRITQGRLSEHGRRAAENSRTFCAGE